MTAATPKFREALIALVRAERRDAITDAVRMAGVIDALAVALGSTVALAVRGNPSGIDELLTGIESRVHEVAVGCAPGAKLFPNYKEPARD